MTTRRRRLGLMTFLCCVTLCFAAAAKVEALVITAVDAAGNPLAVYTPPLSQWVLSPLDPDGGSRVIAAGNGYEVDLATHQWGALEGDGQPRGIWGAGIVLPLPNPSIPGTKGYRVDFTTQLRSWDAYNEHLPPAPGASSGFWDSFHVNMNGSEGFYWNLVEGKCRFPTLATCDGTELIDPLTAPKQLIAPFTWVPLTGGLPHSGGVPLTVGAPTGPGMLPGTTWQWGGRDYASGFFESNEGSYHLVFVHNDFANNLVSAASVFLSLTLDTATTPSFDDTFPSWGAFNAPAGSVPLPAVGVPPGSDPSNPLLPNAFGDDGSFLFNDITVGTGVLWIDPALAIGYEYQVTGPNFTTVTLPTGIGDGSYVISIFNPTTGSFAYIGTAIGGLPYSFPIGGVSLFRVLGIEPSAQLNPADPTAFVTGLTFLVAGIADLRMTPITTTNVLTALRPAKVWLGLANSDAVGLRADLLVEVHVDGVLVGVGERRNVATGSSGFNNALLYEVPLELVSGPVALASNSEVAITIAARRTCFGGGHGSGRLRLWYNGRPIDSFTKSGPRDAGTRFDLSVDGTAMDLFLRTGKALSTTAGTARTAVDASVGSSSPCPHRPYTPFGASWNRSLSLP